MHMAWRALIIAARLGGFAAADAAGAEEMATTPPIAPPAVEATVDADVDASAPQATATYLISPTGVGPVRKGVALSELRASVPGLTIEHEPNFSGEIAEAERILINGEPVAHITLDGTPDCLGREPVIDYIFTSSPLARTAEGVGPGSLLRDAVTAYGEATLIITIIESREYVTFANHPGRLAIRVGTRDPDVWRGGVYPDADASSIGAQTTTFRDDAVIMSMEDRKSVV